jgi:hypothetical protein
MPLRHRVTMILEQEQLLEGMVEPARRCRYRTCT